MHTQPEASRLLLGLATFSPFLWVHKCHVGGGWVGTDTKVCDPSASKALPQLSTNASGENKL